MELKQNYLKCLSQIKTSELDQIKMFWFHKGAFRLFSF